MAAFLPSPLFVLLLACCLGHVTCWPFSSFLSSSQDANPWDLCAVQWPGGRCSCPQNELEAMKEGLDCSRKGIFTIKDLMVFPALFHKVSLSGNNLSAIGKASFASNNTNVLELDLSANILESVGPNTFDGLANLISLDLSNNKIKVIGSKSLSGLPNLTNIDLGYNSITSLTDGFFDQNTKLEKIVLSYNPISTLAANTFMSLKGLTYLDLTFLNLKTIHSDLFSGNSLQTLLLVNNHLQTVPTKALFQAANTLRVLDLSGNPIQTLPAYSLYQLPHLEEVRLLQMVELRNIEAFAFNELVALRTVVFKYLPKVEFLDEMTFVTMVNTTEVLPPIQDFSFSFTVMKQLPKKLLDWSQLKYINLHHNQWTCDCNMKWIKGSPVEAIAGNEMYCSYPARVRGSFISMLDEKDFICKPGDNMEDGWQWGAFAAIFVLAVLVSVGTVALLFYRRNGYLCSSSTDYNKLQAQSRESIVIHDATGVTPESAIDHRTTN